MSKTIDDEKKTFTLIGLFTTAFAAAELGLDLCNIALFHFCGGSAVQSSIPRSLKKKIEFFEKCQSECSPLIEAEKDFRDQATKLTDEFKAIRTDRHFIVHGIAVEALKEEAISFTKFTYNRLREDTRIISVKSMQSLTKRSFQLVQSTLGYAIFLLRFVPEDQLARRLREEPEVFEFLKGLFEHSPDWIKSKNPACEAVRRKAEEDWGR